MAEAQVSTERPLRRDASRNRDRIIAVARDALDEGRPLQFNEIARQAEVGIGTVYRHFASAESLREAAVLGSLQTLLDTTTVLQATEPWAAFAAFLAAAVAAQRDDPALAAVVAQPDDALDETAGLRAELGARFETMLRDAAAAGALRPDVTAADVTALLCGTAYATRIDRDATGRDSTARYLDILLAGLHT